VTQLRSAKIRESWGPTFHLVPKERKMDKFGGGWAKRIACNGSPFFNRGGNYWGTGKRTKKFYSENTSGGKRDPKGLVDTGPLGKSKTFRLPTVTNHTQ